MHRHLDYNRAGTLRRAQTDAERVLWHHLRGRNLRGMKFRRQQPIGRYTVDFVCQEGSLIVELDGGHHNEDAYAARDAERTRFLIQAGYRVLRFWNNDVQQNIEGVVRVIEQQLITPHPNPLPQGERG